MFDMIIIPRGVCNANDLKRAQSTSKHKIVVYCKVRNEQALFNIVVFGIGI